MKEDATVPDPVDLLVEVLEWLKVPAVIIVGLVTLDRLRAWWSLVRSGTGFLTAVGRSMKELVEGRTSRRLRALSWAVVAQSIAVALVYASTAALEVGGPFNGHLDFSNTLHPTSNMIGSTVTAVLLTTSAVLAAMVHGGNRWTGLVCGAESLCALASAGWAAVSALIWLLGVLISPSVVASWGINALVCAALGGGFLLAASMPVEVLKGP